MKILKKTTYAIRLFIGIIKRPEVFQIDIMRLLSGMFDFLRLTAESKRPMSSGLELRYLGGINVKDTKNLVLHLWCGVNEKDNPITRLKELAEENEKLKDLLRKRSEP